MADSLELYASAYERPILLKDFYDKKEKATPFSITVCSDEKEKSKKITSEDIRDGWDSKVRKAR